MYIDFHFHAFADKIAKRAVAQLESVAEYLHAETDGTIADTLKKMDKWGIDKAVLLPIATKPTQEHVVNDWAASVKSERFYAFGSVHPDSEDALDELERIKSLGLNGVKFHPDYQEFFIDEPKMLPLYRKCAELGLPVIFHAGFDPLSPDVVHALPEASARVFDAVPDMTMILAHLGGMYHWDEVEKYLVGRKGNLFLDTAFVGDRIADEQLERIIRNHGAERILFASDCPWDDPRQEINAIERLALSDEEKECIFFKNAERILNA